MILRFTIGLVALMLAVAVLAAILYVVWNFTVLVFLAVLLYFVYILSRALGDFIMEQFDAK
jgi:hypothetical protein